MDEAVYVCDNCGEEIVIPVDISQGSEQTFVEDCPVCCHPHVIRIEMDDEGQVWATAAPEQDRY